MQPITKHDDDGFDFVCAICARDIEPHQKKVLFNDGLSRDYVHKGDCEWAYHKRAELEHREEMKLAEVCF